MVWGFVVFLVLFSGIGVSSILRRKSNPEDYLVAGRSINPWFTALSAAATNNSGYMFIGFFGFTYLHGISAAWIMVGWTLGDYLTWLFVNQRVREHAGRTGALTIPSLLSAGIAGNRRIVTALAGLVTAWFLTIYAGAQLKASGKAMQVLFGWPEWGGAVLGVGIVVLYCFAGGIRASIWTDVAQSLVMIASMLLLLVAAVLSAGGVAPLWHALERIDPALVDPLPDNLAMGFALYMVGWTAAGIGTIGQPHIMVRLLALDSPRNVGRARRIYIVWNVIFVSLVIAVALASRVFIPADSNFDAELALPSMASQLLPAFFVGVVLAGLFAAILSTADSQILSVSAALNQDIFPKWKRSYAAAKAGTLCVAGVALWIALAGGANVFRLVVDAWSALASGLAPLMIVQVFGKPPRAGTAVGMIIGGLVAMHCWTLFTGLSESLHSAVPGMLTGFLIYFEFKRRA